MKGLLLAILWISTAVTIFGQSAVVISIQANLRGTPSEAGRVIDTVRQNDKLDVVKQNGAWFLVQSPELVGWIHGNTIKLTSSDGLDDIVRLYTAPVKQQPAPSVVYTTPSPRSSAGSRQYFRGPRGGCYYLNGSGRKTYVDHSYCN